MLALKVFCENQIFNSNELRICVTLRHKVQQFSYLLCSYFSLLYFYFPLLIYCNSLLKMYLLIIIILLYVSYINNFYNILARFGDTEINGIASGEDIISNVGAN